MFHERISLNEIIIKADLCSNVRLFSYNFIFINKTYFFHVHLYSFKVRVLEKTKQETEAHLTLEVFFNQLRLNFDVFNRTLGYNCQIQINMQYVNPEQLMFIHLTLFSSYSIYSSSTDLF